MIATLRAIGAVCILASATCLAPQAMAQSETDLAALDAQLPGELVNDPSRMDWEGYGSDLSETAIVDETIPGGGVARRYQVRRASEFIYTAGLKIPLTESVDRGDTITIGFYARTIEAATSDGRGVLRVRFQQDLEPYPGFGEETVTIGSDWEWYEVSADVEQKLRRKDGIVTLQFGRTRQIIEIGQAIVVSGAAKIADQGPVTVAAARIEIPELEMPDSLEGLGTLLNEPGQARWKFGGSVGTFVNRDEPEIWMMKATRFSVSQDGTNLTDLAATIPLRQPIAEGDELLVAIAAKTISSGAADGKGVAASRIQGTFPPFESFASNRFKIGSNWQLIRIKTKAPRAYSAGGSELELYFAGSQQEIDLGPVYVIKLDK